MPSKKTAKITLMMVSARLVLRWVGAQNAFTPFDTASTPVMAVQPAANTLSNNQIGAEKCLAAAWAVEELARDVHAPRTISRLPLHSRRANMR